MYRSSRFSLLLLFIFALPIMLETEKILYLWLGQIPAETVTFVRIMFCVIALETMSNSIMTGITATGDIKRYQITVSSILLAIVPAAYIALKSGAPAKSVFIVYLAIEIIAVAARLAIAHDMLKLDIKKFVKHVALRSAAAIAAGSLLPLILHSTMPDGYTRFATVITSGVITSLAAIYLLGLDRQERVAINRAAVEKIRKKKQTGR